MSLRLGVGFGVVGVVIGLLIASDLRLELRLSIRNNSLEKVSSRRNLYFYCV